jgi:signal recognition particle receptor subunit beta
MNTVLVLLGLVAVIAVVVVLALRGRSGSGSGSSGGASPAKKSTVLLVGPNSAGKTTLHQRLSRGVAVETVNSVSEHSFTGALKDPSISRGQGHGEEEGAVQATLIDIPGFPQSRERAVNMAAQSAGVVFVVDSAAEHHPSKPGTHFKSAADLLYELLTSPSFVESGTPLLIACNKQDVAGARTVEAVKALLETELELLKMSRPTIQTLDGTANIRAAQKKSGARKGDADGSAPVQLFLGREGVKFSFEEDAPVRVQWCGCVVNNNAAAASEKSKNNNASGNLSGVFEFIRECVANA